MIWFYQPTESQVVCVGMAISSERRRWRVGGGINVPLKVQVQMTRMKATNLLRTLNQIEIQNTLIMKETEEILKQAISFLIACEQAGAGAGIFCRFQVGRLTSSKSTLHFG